MRQIVCDRCGAELDIKADGILDISSYFDFRDDNYRDIEGEYCHECAGAIAVAVRETLSNRSNADVVSASQASRRGQKTQHGFETNSDVRRATRAHKQKIQNMTETDDE